MHVIDGICVVRMAANTTPLPQTTPEICRPSSFHTLQAVDTGIVTRIHDLLCSNH